MKCKPIIHVVWALTVAVVVGASAAALAGTQGDAAKVADFSAVGARRDFDHTPAVSEWTYEAKRGPSSYDRIGLERVARRAGPLRRSGIVMLYLPGTNMNGAVAVDDPRYSLPLYMAQNDVDFWSLDYRTHFVPAAAAKSDLTQLKSWTSEVFESDIDDAVRFIIATTGRRRIFIGGFSRGVSFAYLYAAAHPKRVQGLVMFDGWIPAHKRDGAPPPRYADDLGGQHLTWEKRQALLELVLKNPDAPAPIAKYKTAVQNLEHVVYDSASFGGHGGLANPIGGFSDPVVLAHVMIRYDRYWPTIQDYENSFSPERMAALKRSKIPVIAFSSTNIAADWYGHVATSASSTGSADVTVRRLNNWGHLDVICGTKAESEVFAPTLEWLRQHRK
jgi:pimeloyl-ACP methyl ester carboxylesterase